MTMSDFWDTYAAWVQLNGTTEKDRTVNSAKKDFVASVKEHPGYISDAKRNGVSQTFLITRSNEMYKSNIVAMPDESLDIGDIIEAFGQHWIVYQMRENSSVTRSGLLWLCNHLFRFQNHDGQIIERYGVLDRGVFSSTIGGDVEINFPDQQYRVYLPYDGETKKIFIDTRFAIGTMYNARGEEILDVYRVTAINHVAQSYGDGGHLLTLSCRGDIYNEATDNLALQICDYIVPTPTPPTPTPPTPAKTCSIEGRSTIRTGGSRTYKATFVDEHGDPVTGIQPVWTVAPTSASMHLTTDEDMLIVALDDANADNISAITITLTDADSEYGETHKRVEVENVGS